MKFLSIDYGLRHLGFAVAETPFATPHSVAHVKSLQEALAATQKTVAATHPDKILIGIPDGPIAHDVNKFVSQLHVTIPVITHPETLSSVEATSKLHSIGASRTKMKNDHAYAACLILEDYLDLHPDLVKI